MRIFLLLGGRTEDDGTYFYTAQYQIDCDGESQSKTLNGFITVIR
jgi:hypothetical protein